MRTVVEPIMIVPGPAGMHPGNKQGMVIEVTVAAGRLPIKTVGAPGGMMASGNPGCGSGVGAGAGGWIGAWQCGIIWITMSLTRAAGGLTVHLARIPRARGSRDARCAVQRPAE